MDKLVEIDEKLEEIIKENGAQKLSHNDLQYVQAMEYSCSYLTYTNIRIYRYIFCICILSHTTHFGRHNTINVAYFSIVRKTI